MRSVRSSTAGSSARRTTVGRAVRESTAVRESEAEEPMYVPHLLLHSSTMCLQSFSSASRSSADGDPVRSRRRTGGRGVANRRSADLVVRLCNNMTRFLQLFRAADSDQDGKVSYDEFERVITAMRLGHDPKDSRRLFRALDAEDTGSARLDSLMKLKLDLDDGKFEEFFKNRGVEDALVDDMGPPEESTHGCFRKYIVKPTMGALWKSSLRPHHALETNRHKWLEHTRGTPRVHAMLGLRSYVDDDDEAGTRVVLALVPARGELNAPRRRKVYRAGPVPDFMAWIDQSQESLMQAAQHAATECDDLLTEVRQVDLKLEEAYLSQRFPGSEELQAYKLHRLYLEALTDGSEAAAVALSHVEKPVHLDRGGEAFQPERVRTVTRFAQLLMLCLVMYLITSLIIYFEASENSLPMREACELERAREIGCDIPNSDRWDEFDDVECDLDSDLLKTSYVLIINLVPLIALSICLPFGLLWNNTWRLVVRKVILWTPSVPLILAQMLVRAVVFTQVAVNAADEVYAAINAVEAWCLLGSVATFCFMDAMIVQTPKLRIVYGISLMLRFGASTFQRMLFLYAAEQCPALPRFLAPSEDAWLHGETGISTARAQSIILSIDWAVVSLLSGAFISSLLEPSQMAVVRLRCDARAYFNWREVYMRKLALRTTRRDRDLSDTWAWLNLRLFSAREKTADQIGLGRAPATPLDSTRYPTDPGSARSDWRSMRASDKDKEISLGERVTYAGQYARAKLTELFELTDKKKREERRQRQARGHGHGAHAHLTCPMGAAAQTTCLTCQAREARHRQEEKRRMSSQGVLLNIGRTSSYFVSDLVQIGKLLVSSAQDSNAPVYREKKRGNSGGPSQAGSPGYTPTPFSPIAEESTVRGFGEPSRRLRFPANSDDVEVDRDGLGEVSQRFIAEVDYDPTNPKGWQRPPPPPGTPPPPGQLMPPARKISPTRRKRSSFADEPLDQPPPEARGSPPPGARGAPPPAPAPPARKISPTKRTRSSFADVPLDQPPPEARGSPPAAQPPLASIVTPAPPPPVRTSTSGPPPLPPPRRRDSARTLAQPTPGSPRRASGPSAARRSLGPPCPPPDSPRVSPVPERAGLPDSAPPAAEPPARESSPGPPSLPRRESSSEAPTLATRQAAMRQATFRSIACAAGAVGSAVSSPRASLDRSRQSFKGAAGAVRERAGSVRESAGAVAGAVRERASLVGSAVATPVREKAALAREKVADKVNEAREASAALGRVSFRAPTTRDVQREMARESQRLRDEKWRELNDSGRLSYSLPPVAAPAPEPEARPALSPRVSKPELGSGARTGADI